MSDLRVNEHVKSRGHDHFDEEHIEVVRRSQLVPVSEVDVDVVLEAIHHTYLDKGHGDPEVHVLCLDSLADSH